MQALLLISSVTLALLSRPCIKLAKNYIKARKIGLPVLVTPISFFNFLWLLSNHRLAPLLKALPFGLGNFVDHSGFSWYFADRYRHHARLGPAFCVVSPGEVQVILADPDAADDVLARRKEFQRDETVGKPLEIFGPTSSVLATKLGSGNVESPHLLSMSVTAALCGERLLNSQPVC